MTATTAISTMTISEILALLPSATDWKIVDRHEATFRTSSGAKGSIYWDSQDPANEGWAYRIAGSDERPEESGPLTDADDVRNVFAW